MAKTKKEKIVDLKPKAEKITGEQLRKLQEVVNNLNRAQLEIGQLETRKHNLLHGVAGLNDELILMQREFEKEYGTFDIDIQTGKINHQKNGEADKKD